MKIATRSFATIVVALAIASGAFVAGSSHATSQKPTEKARNGVAVDIFSGQVITRAGAPIPKAVVEVGGKTATTDSKGVFRVSIPAKRVQGGTRYVLNIRKDGFGLVSRVYFGGLQGGRWTMAGATTVMIDPTVANTVTDTTVPSCNGSLSSQADWSQYPNRRTPYLVDGLGQYSGPAPAQSHAAVTFAENSKSCNERASITIPAKSIVDAQGNAPTSRVAVSISTVDIYEPDAMPGDDSVAVGQQSGYMVTYGAGMVTLNADGKPLQLKKGSNATLTIPVNALQRKQRKAPPTLRLLVYDEGAGIWRDMGEGRLNAQRTAYVGTITHLSAFNFDLVKTGQSCVRVNSSAIPDDYRLEVSLIYDDNAIVKTLEVDNTPEKLHVVYNLPSNTIVTMRAFRAVGAGAVPITDSVAVNTGAPQNPGTPNRPAYPYAACASQVNLTPASAVPLLSAPATSYGTFTLSWDYDWSGGFVSNQDGYVLQRSTTGTADASFSTIYQTSYTSADDHRPHVDYPVTEPTNSYWYRVRAMKAGVASPWSNIRNVVVDTAGTVASPRTLRIINDLEDRTDVFARLNGLVRVRIATTCDQAIGGTGERLSASDTGPLPGEVIPPRYLQDSSFRDFDVTGITLAPGNTYCVYIEAGWWDMILNPTTYEFMYWERKATTATNCTGTSSVVKNQIITIIQPFFEPEVIRASDWLPHWSTWQGHETCP